MSLPATPWVLSVARHKPVSGSLLDAGATSYRPAGGSVTVISAGRTGGVSGSLLNIGASRGRVKRFNFNGLHAVGIGDYAIGAVVDGDSVPVCELAETLRIAHGENENYICEFVLKKGSPRRKPQAIDPYRWYARPISVWLHHAGGRLLIYRGVVDGVKLDPLKGTFAVKCSDRRERMINALPADTIRAIGYTDKSIHGEFDSKLDELNKRLSTVPASYEFDLQGNGYLTSWLPENPVMTLTPCMIYQQNPSVTLAEARSVINEAEVKLTFNYPRLLQRSLQYSLNIGIGVCQYQQYGKLPTLEAVHEAARQTGWELGGFQFEREDKSGWKHCGGPLGHLRARDSTAIAGGYFELLKRWTQPVAETYTLRLYNAASIKRYELGREEHAYTVSADTEAKNWGESGFGPHAQGLKYELTTGDRFHAHPFGLPHQDSTPFQIAANGDFYLNLDDNGRLLANALNTAYWTAYVKMLSSHRQNTVQVQAKLLPRISIRHSHRIGHSHFDGVAKVSRFEHTFDFKTKRGGTEVQYRFFQNAVSGSLTELAIPPRPQPAFPPREQFVWLGKVEIPEEADVSRYWGMIYRKHPVMHRQQLYTALALRIRTPEIERPSTDTAEVAQQARQEVGIPNNPIAMRL